MGEPLELFHLDKLPDDIIESPRETRIYSKKAAKKLEELQFDPIEQMIEMYRQLEKDIFNMMYDETGDPKRFSTIAMTTLVSVKQRIISDLLRYGYARAIETVEINTMATMPIQINLTGTPVDFDTARLSNAKNIP